MRLLVCTLVWLAALSAKAQVSDFKRVDFGRADSVARLYPGHSLNNLPDLAFKLTSSFEREEEKFRTLYVWICLNIRNDYSLYIRNKEQRMSAKSDTELDAWYAAFSKVIFDKLLNEHKTICTGYAYLLRELALAAGLTCVMVDGYGKTPGVRLYKEYPNHTWNAVRLNGKWYLCDPTWSSGLIDSGSGEFVQKFNSRFFLEDPVKFAKHHYPLDTTWFLLPQKPILNSFLK